jgi:hypothetical protein
MNQIVNAPSHAVILSTGVNNMIYQNQNNVSNDMKNNNNNKIGF